MYTGSWSLGALSGKRLCTEINVGPCDWCPVNLKMSIFPLPSGQCVKSLYTFNAVTALCFVPEEDGYIITGSGVFLCGEDVCVD